MVKTLNITVMENTNENNGMTAQESLSLISETLNNSRREITRRSGKYFLFWGALLTFFSCLIYLLWKASGHAQWNLLWFAMPAIGVPLERLSRRKNELERVQNDVSRINGGVWAAFGVFACSLSLFTVLYAEFGSGVFGPLTAAFSLTASIAALFGLAETITGVVLKNWTIKIAGFVTGIGGLAIYYLTCAQAEQLLIFAFAGLVLVVTGLIVKYQYR